MDIDPDTNNNFREKIKMTAIHISVCFLIYLNMFGLMTYNLEVVITIILGNGLGYYLFAIKSGRQIQSVGCCHSG